MIQMKLCKRLLDSEHAAEERRMEGCRDAGMQD